MSDPAAKMAKTPSTEKTLPVKAETEGGRHWPALREVALDRMLDEFIDDLERGFGWPSRLRRRLEPIFAGAPRLTKIDVFETDDEVVVKAELPGVTKDQIEVEVANGALSVKAEKKHEETVKRENYHRTERSFGTVQRTVELPAEVKADGAVAKLANGVLEVRLPKTEAAKTSSVKVKIQ